MRLVSINSAWPIFVEEQGKERSMQGPMERLGLNPLLKHCGAKGFHCIVTALRGPDDGASTDLRKPKLKYTTPIRCWFYNKTPKELQDLGMTLGDPAPNLAGWKELLDDVDWHGRANPTSQRQDMHFYEHLFYAIQAIISLEVWKSLD